LKIPCEECIMYAMCNVRIKEVSFPDVTRFAYDTDCRDLQLFLKLNRTRSFGGHGVINAKEIIYARKFFKLPIQHHLHQED
jgi:hypothetical protein